MEGRPYRPSSGVERDHALKLVAHYLGETPAGVARVMLMIGPAVLDDLVRACRRQPQFDILAPSTRHVMNPLAPTEVQDAVVVLKRHGLVQAILRKNLVEAESRWAHAISQAEQSLDDDGRKKRKKEEKPRAANLARAGDELLCFNSARALRMTYWPMFTILVQQDLGLNDAAVFAFALRVGSKPFGKIAEATIKRLYDLNERQGDDSELAANLSKEEISQSLARLVARGILIPVSESYEEASRLVERTDLPPASLYAYSRDDIRPTSEVVEESLQGAQFRDWRSDLSEKSLGGRFKKLFPDAKLGARGQCQFPESSLDDMMRHFETMHALPLQINDFFFTRVHLFTLVALHLALSLGDALIFEVVNKVLWLGSPVWDGRIPRRTRRILVQDVQKRMLADPRIFPDDANYRPGAKLIGEAIRTLCSHKVTRGMFTMHDQHMVNRAIVVDIELCLMELRRAAISTLVMSSFGPDEEQVFNCLRDKGLLEESYLARRILAAPEDTRAALNRLVGAGLVQMQEVPRRAEYHPANVVVFWSVSEPAAIYRFAMLAHKSSLNLFIRDDESAFMHRQALELIKVPEGAVKAPANAAAESRLKLASYVEAKQRVKDLQFSLWDSLFVLSDLGEWTELGFGSHATLLAADQAYTNNNHTFLPKAEEL